MTTVGNIGELITGFKEGYFGNIGNGQHMIMFSCFGLTAFMEILHYYKFQVCRVFNLPFYVTVLFHSVSVATEFALFVFNFFVYGRSFVVLLAFAYFSTDGNASTFKPGV